MELCLGTAQIGVFYGINNERGFSEENSIDILHFASENNVQYFDTAQAYGQAESILGKFISSGNCDRNSIKIISKLNGGESLNVQIETSLKKLQAPKIEGCLLHEESMIYNSRTVNELRAIKQQGYVNKIGVSVYGANEALYAASLDWVDYIQIPYNVFDQRLNDTAFFRTAKGNQKTIFARSALLQGLLVMDPEKVRNKLPFAYEEVLLFRNISRKYGMLPIEVAIQYVKNNLNIDFLVVGVDAKEQLKTFIKIFKDSEVPIDMIDEIKEEFRSIDERIIMPFLW